MYDDSDKQFDKEVRMIERTLQKAIDKINWKRLGIKKTGTLTRGEGVRLVSNNFDFQMFVDISGSNR